MELCQVFKIKEEVFELINITPLKINDLWKLKETSYKEVDTSKFASSITYSPDEGTDKITFNKSPKYVSFPSTIRNEISDNFRLYMIKKDKEANANGEEKTFIQKFELNGIEVLFYKEGFDKSGIKNSDIDNEIGKEKDQHMDMSNTMNKSFGR